MSYFKFFWNKALIIFGMLWNALVSFGMLWYIFGTLWDTLGRFGTLWDALDSFDRTGGMSACRLGG